MLVGFVLLHILVGFIVNGGCKVESNWPPAQCRGVKVIYRGDACECPRPLPYRIECPTQKITSHVPRTYGFKVIKSSVPVVVAPEKIQNHDFQCQKPVENQKPCVQRHIGYRIWSPKPRPIKETKVGQVYDTQIECPIVPSVSKPSRTLIARIDRVVLTKKDCECPPEKRHKSSPSNEYCERHKRDLIKKPLINHENCSNNPAAYVMWNQIMKMRGIDIDSLNSGRNDFSNESDEESSEHSNNYEKSFRISEKSPRPNRLRRSTFIPEEGRFEDQSINHEKPTTGCHCQNSLDSIPTFDYNNKNDIHEFNGYDLEPPTQPQIHAYNRPQYFHYNNNGQQIPYFQRNEHIGNSNSYINSATQSQSQPKLVFDQFGHKYITNNGNLKLLNPYETYSENNYRPYRHMSSVEEDAAYFNKIKEMLYDNPKNLEWFNNDGIPEGELTATPINQAKTVLNLVRDLVRDRYNSVNNIPITTTDEKRADGFNDNEAKQYKRANTVTSKTQNEHNRRRACSPSEGDDNESQAQLDPTNIEPVEASEYSTPNKNYNLKRSNAGQSNDNYMAPKKFSRIRNNKNTNN